MTQNQVRKVPEVIPSASPFGALRDGNLLLEWALNLMVLNVSTRRNISRNSARWQRRVVENAVGPKQRQ